jgi:hypothetical protein
MQATYEEPLRETFLTRMRQDAQVSASGSDDEGLSYTLIFSEEGTFSTALDELARRGIKREVPNDTTNTIRISRTSKVSGKDSDTLLLVGLSPPGS